MPPSSPDIIGIVEGRLHVENFRGRNKQLLIHQENGTHAPLAWYDRSYFVKDGEERPEEVPQEKQGIEYTFDRHIFRDILKETLATRAQCETVLLINSFGGRMGVEHLMEAVTDYTKHSGGRVSAYVSSVAVSAASAIMQTADDITVLNDTWSMWHLPNFPLNYREYLARCHGEDRCDVVLDRHNTMRHDILRQKLYALASRMVPEHQRVFREEVERIMGLHSVRHEVSLTGAQLHSYGIARESYPTFADMEHVIRERHAMHSRDAEWRTDPLSRYFVFSRIEEKLRNRYGVRFKILLKRSGGIMVQECLHDTQKCDSVRKEMEADIERELERIV